MRSTNVPDGATQRHARLLDLKAYVRLGSDEGRTLTHIQAYMLKIWGLKFKTTGQMVHELCMAGELTEDGHGFYRLTRTVEKTRGNKKEILAAELKKIQDELSKERELRKKLEKTLQKIQSSIKE